MKNKTWVNFNNRQVTVYLHMSGYFNETRMYVKKDNGATVYTEIYNRPNSRTPECMVRIKCWYLKNTESQGATLFDVIRPYEKDKKVELRVSFPDCNPDIWVAPVLSNCDVVRAKPTSDNAYYYEHNIGYVITPKNVDKDKIGLELNLNEYYTKKQAKEAWKNIKRNNYVSKFYWDSWMGYYDCYCKACAVDGIICGQHKYNWRSWVGNPDIGYVRPVGFKCDKNDGIFKYKGSLYEPCSADEYDRLTFFTNDEYKKEKERLSLEDSFNKIWKIELTDEEIASNGNVTGGAWKTPDGKIIGNTNTNVPEGSKKLVTLGWHRSDPENAIRCPVCDDLFNIICHSVYNPVPFVYQIREYMAHKFWWVRRFFEKIKWTRKRKA